MKDKNWPGNPLPLCDDFASLSTVNRRSLETPAGRKGHIFLLGVCVLGGRGGGVREETSPAEVEEKPNRHETPNCEQLRGSRAWPLTSGRPIDKSSTFYSPVQQDGEGVEPRGGGPGTAGGGARGALRITVNVFGESFWETQKKTNMQIICRVKFIVSFSINEKYADFFPLGFFVLKCIS